MSRIKNFFDWLFKDLNGRRGKYVIAEVPNLPLIIFMVAIILSVAIYPGIVQKFFSILAYVSLMYWGFREWRGGRSRFRRLLGILGMVGVIGAVFLMI